MTPLIESCKQAMVVSSIRRQPQASELVSAPAARCGRVEGNKQFALGAGESVTVTGMTPPIEVWAVVG